jgi:hypothetical protein
MQRRRRFSGRVTLLSAVMLAACSSTNIRDLNLRPDKHYEQKLTVSGRVMRMQAVGDDTLLEIADPRDSRVLVRASHPVDATVGDWVKVTGVLVPEARVGDTVLYDVLTAEDISHTGSPWFPDLM